MKKISAVLIIFMLVCIPVSLTSVHATSKSSNKSNSNRAVAYSSGTIVLRTPNDCQNPEPRTCTSVLNGTSSMQYKNKTYTDLTTTALIKVNLKKRTSNFAGGWCFDYQGNGYVTSEDGDFVIKFSGDVCDVALMGYNLPHLYTGKYEIKSGTKKFKNIELKGTLTGYDSGSDYSIQFWKK